MNMKGHDLEIVFVHLFQTDLEAAKVEVQKWHSIFQHESAIPSGATPGNASLL